MDREEVLEKVRKLFALSASDNEHEASLALQAAHKLMMKWAIEEHELRAGKKADFVKILLYRGGKIPFEVSQTGVILHEYFNVRCISVRLRNLNKIRVNHEYHLVGYGTKEACEFADYVFNYLLNTYNRLWYRRAAANNWGRAQRRNYLHGVINGFEQYLKSLKAQEEKECKALLVIGKELTTAFEKEFPEMQSRTIRINTRNADDVNARHLGVKDGKEIRVSPGIGSSNRTHERLS